MKDGNVMIKNKIINFNMLATFFGIASVVLLLFINPNPKGAFYLCESLILLVVAFILFRGLDAGSKYQTIFWFIVAVVFILISLFFLAIMILGIAACDMNNRELCINFI